MMIDVRNEYRYRNKIAEIECHSCVTSHTSAIQQSTPKSPKYVNA